VGGSGGVGEMGMMKKGKQSNIRRNRNEKEREKENEEKSTKFTNGLLTRVDVQIGKRRRKWK
jgi:hypothetical protein